MYGLRLPNLTIRGAAFSCVVVSLAFVVSFPFLVVPSALAAPLPVAINPTRIEITASPGDQVESSFKFWNGTDTDLPVHLPWERRGLKGSAMKEEANAKRVSE